MDTLTAILIVEGADIPHGPNEGQPHSEEQYIESNRSVVDYKALCAALGITAEQVAEYTKTTAVFSVKVTSR